MYCDYILWKLYFSQSNIYFQNIYNVNLYLLFYLNFGNQPRDLIINYKYI